ncbi:unnamed protein product, partial [marine sediment metagenome]
MEPRIALTATVYGVEQAGDTPGFISIVIDESGEDLFLRQTLQTTGDGLNPRPAIQYADNPSFRGGDEVFFATNDLNTAESYQDVFVTQGVRNSFQQDFGLPNANPQVFLTAADDLATVNGVPQLDPSTGLPFVLPAGMTADTTYHVVPGTFGGSRNLDNFVASSATVRFPGGPNFATIYFDTQFISDESDNNVQDGIQDIQLVFSRDPISRSPSELVLDFSLNDGGSNVNLTVRGYADPNTGEIGFFYRSTGPVALETSYDINYASPVISDQPSTVTLASGLTLDAGFIVDLPSDDSTITINSPIDSPSRAGAT